MIVSYEDRPHNYDAWDVNNYYTEKSWDIDTSICDGSSGKWSGKSLRKSRA